MPMEKRHADKKRRPSCVSHNFIYYLLLFFGFALAGSLTQGRVYAYTQQFSTITSGSSVDCGMQTLGTGLSGSIDEVSIRVINDTANAVPINNPIRIVEYDDSNYTCTYPCYSNIISASSYSYYPAGRYSGSSITAGSQEPVQITASYSGKSFNPSKFYTVGYMASNYGNRLKIQGINYDNWVYGQFRWDRTTSYCRIDQPFNFSATGNGLTDMYFAFNDDIGYPYMVVSGSEVVDPLSNTVQVDLSGDFLQVDSGYSGYIQVKKVCTREGFPLIKTDIADVHIRVNATCETETTTIGAGFYYGYEYCDSPEDTHWKADRVSLPYPAGYSCEYPTEYCLYDENGQPIRCGDFGNIILGTITSGSEYNVEEPPKSDPIAWLGWKIGQVLTDLFSFKNVDTNQFNILKANINNHVPFAYATTIFNSDWSSPVTSGSAMPSLAFTFATGGSYNYVPDGAVATVLGTIRPVLLIVLWLGLVTYIVFRVRELAHSL
jgi:hypothetical protein